MLDKKAYLKAARRHHARRNAPALLFAKRSNPLCKRVSL
jgi:hypothetical protein